jgi:hypothetical protein
MKQYNQQPCPKGRGIKPLNTNKAKFLALLMVLGATVIGTAIEREAEIIFFEQNGSITNYYLDTTQDNLPNQRMDISSTIHGESIVTILSRYLQQPSTKIIFEDEGLRPNEAFGAGRMIGFIRPDGQSIRLDQLFTSEVIRQHFSYLWKKIQAEQGSS